MTTPIFPPNSVVIVTTPGDTPKPIRGTPIHDGSIVWVGNDGLADWQNPTAHFTILLPPADPKRPRRHSGTWHRVAPAGEYQSGEGQR